MGCHLSNLNTIPTLLPLSDFDQTKIKPQSTITPSKTMHYNLISYLHHYKQVVMQATNSEPHYCYRWHYNFLLIPVVCYNYHGASFIEPPSCVSTPFFFFQIFYSFYFICLFFTLWTYIRMSCPILETPLILVKV